MFGSDLASNFLKRFAYCFLFFITLPFWAEDSSTLLAGFTAFLFFLVCSYFSSHKNAPRSKSHAFFFLTSVAFLGTKR